MKAVLIPCSATQGVVELSDEDALLELGLFDAEKIKEILSFCVDMSDHDCAVELAAVRRSDGLFALLIALLMRPRLRAGEGWIALAPLTEEADE